MSGEPDGSLRRLVETGIALGAESSLDRVLQRLVEAAAELVGARAAALEVAEVGAWLGRVVATGFDPVPAGAAEERLTPPDEQEDLRRHLPDELRASSILTAPVVVRGLTFGNLYVIDKAEGFSAEDEEIARVLAAQGAAAIENVRLYESARRWSWQLESLNEVSRALAHEPELASLLELTAGRLCELLGARGAMLALPAEDGQELVVEAAAGDVPAGVLGMRLAVSRSRMGQALRHRRSERIDSIIDDPEVDQSAARIIAATSTLVVPLVVGERVLAVVAAWDKLGGDPRFTDVDLRLAEAFADRAALAIELIERVSRQAVERLLEGQERERSRIARDLHDDTLQALGRLRVTLASAHEDGGLDAHRDATRSALEQIDAEIANVRTLVTDLRPPGLRERGSEAALQALVERSARSGLDVRLEADLAFEHGRAPTRHEPELEAAIVRIVQEALQNAAKHSGVGKAFVRVVESDSEVEVTIEDRGRGFDPAAAETEFGLLGIRERVELLGGTLEIDSAPKMGTTIRARLPVRRRGPSAVS